MAFTVFLLVKVVDGHPHSYEWDLALRAVETIDIMTDHWAHLHLETVSSCTMYDVSSKPPAMIEWE
ncbi:hypothetical protein HNO51_03130 [Billgrantia sulfidoxydans]|uniref:GMP synthase C-terminal domain-containing protein n=1 Tax=Billgrantia sulfidoxydans TaxID=2733484 RepID=A0ABX7W9E5_9GAMM|nr:hypothetical protein HNO51_03130 [Halomonas sulfidoxydans]